VSIGKVILVILATLVIFGTGLVTGVVIVKQVSNAPPKPSGFVEGPGWPQFLHRIQPDLELTPEQEQRIGQILRESQDRTRGFAGNEFRKVREQIRSELMPPQADKFERLVKERQRRMQEMRAQQEGRFGPRSNGPMSFEGLRRPPFTPRPAQPPPAETPQ